MSNDSPAVILYDSSGNPLVVGHGESFSSTKGILVAGLTDAVTGGNTEFMMVGEGGGVAISAYTNSSSMPDPGSYVPNTRTSTLMSDQEGSLRVRAQVLSDEGIFKDGFAGSSLESSLTGTVAFTNGSMVVAGSGTTFTTEITSDDYIRLTSDGQDDYVQVGKVITDELVYLAVPYPGATGASTGVRSYWPQTIVGSATITVTSSEVRLSPGTVSGDSAAIEHFVDYGPLSVTFDGRITARNANQTSIVALEGTSGGLVAVVFTGTDNTKIIFRTKSSFSSANNDTEIDLSYFDDTWDSATSLTYQFSVRPSRADLYIEGRLVSTHIKYLPGPYEKLSFIASTENSATTTTTQLIVEQVTSESINLLQVDSIVGEVKSVLYAEGREVAVTNGDVLDNYQPLIVMGGKSDQSDIVRPFLVDDYGSLKAVIQPPVPPPDSTPVAISQDDADLSIDGTDSPADTDYTIPNGKTFYLQTVLGGAEGDPSEKGSRIDVVYVDSSSNEHVITRLYLVGQSISSIFPDSPLARDGTTMAGNGTTTKIVLRRIRLSNAAQEVDGEVRGYVK